MHDDKTKNQILERSQLIEELKTAKLVQLEALQKQPVEPPRERIT